MSWRRSASAGGGGLASNRGVEAAWGAGGGAGPGYDLFPRPDQEHARCHPPPGAGRNGLLLKG